MLIFCEIGLILNVNKYFIKVKFC